ncbi:MAG: PIN domain-containing protein [Deltaproteobacteria bacterium]|nr:PIN domain-containing protein [Deltaproteobacteria bacterium]
MYVIDTNILLYAADHDSPFHESCFDLLEESRRSLSVWYLTWGICYEFLRVVTHPKVFKKPLTITKAWSFMEALIESPSLSFLLPTSRHAEVVKEVFKALPNLSGNILHDTETAILMKEHGVKIIYTKDIDFKRFPFIKKIDPTL